MIKKYIFLEKTNLFQMMKKNLLLINKIKMMQ
jgi:hypothetical protein